MFGVALIKPRRYDVRILGFRVTKKKKKKKKKIVNLRNIVLYHVILFVSGSLEISFTLYRLLYANQMTVSVTGATGFIGRRLVQRLHAGKSIFLKCL